MPRFTQNTTSVTALPNLMFYKISLLTLLICLCWNSSQALTISITDQDGQAVSNAVVGVSPVAASQQNNASKPT